MLRTFSPSSLARQYRTELLLLAAALVVQVVYRFLVPVVDTPDSVTYLEDAGFFAGRTDHYPHYYRPPGYPFLVFLSLYPFTGSIRALLFLQSAMAVFTPLLAYRALLIFGKRTACIGAVLILASLSHCYFSTAIMSEQPYIFCLMLFLLSVSRLCAAPTAGGFFLATVYALLTVFIRGLVAPLLLVPLALALAKCRRQTGAAALSLAVCLALFFGWIVAKNRFSPEIGPAQQTSNLSLTNLEGKTLFSNVYLFSTVFNSSLIADNGQVAMPEPKVSPDNGPQSRRLFDILKQDWAQYPQTYLPSPNAETAAADYEATPSIRKWLNLSFSIVDRQLGVVEADRLLNGVAWEAIRRHPEVALTWLTNSLLYVMGPPYMMQHDFVPVFYVPRLYIYYQSTESMKDKHHLKRTAPQVINRFAQGYGVVFLLLKPLSFMLTLMLTPYWARRHNGLFTGTLVAILLYHVAATSVFSAPAERYVFTSFPFFLMLLAIGLGAWWDARPTKPIAPPAP